MIELLTISVLPHAIDVRIYERKGSKAKHDRRRYTFSTWTAVLEWLIGTRDRILVPRIEIRSYPR